MARSTIYKKWEKEVKRYFRNEIMIGTSRETHLFWMKEITVYRGNTSLYSIKETDRCFWFFTHCLYPISLFLQMFFCRKYEIFEGDELVGASQNTHTKPARTFTIHSDEYCLFVHKSNQFSLTRNGKQIALYKRASASAYSVDFDQDEPIEIIDLFCLFIDETFFDDHRTAKIYVFRDPHSEHTLWNPEK